MGNGLVRPHAITERTLAKRPRFMESFSRIIPDKVSSISSPHTSLAVYVGSASEVLKISAAYNFTWVDYELAANSWYYITEEKQNGYHDFYDTFFNILLNKNTHLQTAAATSTAAYSGRWWWPSNVTTVARRSSKTHHDPRVNLSVIRIKNAFYGNLKRQSHGLFGAVNYALRSAYRVLNGLNTDFKIIYDIHKDFHITIHDYEYFVRCIIQTLRLCLGRRWSIDLCNAWVLIFEFSLDSLRHYINKRFIT